MNGTDEIAKENEVDWYHRREQKRHHQLEIVKTLGEGTHGKVLLAKDPASSQQVVICCLIILQFHYSLLILIYLIH